MDFFVINLFYITIVKCSFIVKGKMNKLEAGELFIENCKLVHITLCIISKLLSFYKTGDSFLDLDMGFLSIWYDLCTHINIKAGLNKPKMALLTFA